MKYRDGRSWLAQCTKCLRVTASILGLAALTASCSSSPPSSKAAVPSLSSDLHALVAMKDGPIGAIALVEDGSRVRISTAGVADVSTGGAVTPNDSVRIASVSKAFSGAVALALVSKGKLSVNSTIGEYVSALPASWGKVTLGELLEHTSGLPDYSANPEYIAKLQADPLAVATPAELMKYVSGEPLLFAPGSEYHYSNSDNIVVAMMVAAVTGESYQGALSSTVLVPLSLTRTSLPNTAVLDAPALHGYDVQAGHPPEDVTSVINPSQAGSSGGIVSTPAELNTFMRAYVGGHLFDAAVRSQQLHFVAGNSDPPGPGTNSAGLGIFRYVTGCGTVYGHTGNFPGYTVFAASTLDGAHSEVVIVNTQVSEKTAPKVLSVLRSIDTAAVCSAGTG